MSKKRSSAELTVEEAVSPSEVSKEAPEVVYVVAYLHHIDDYKRAESDSDVVAVHKNAGPAYKFAILQNVENNEENRSSETLDGFLAKKQDVEVEDIDYNTEAISEVLEAIHDVKVLEKIYTEMQESLQEAEGMYTMQASQKVYSVYAKTVDITE